MAGLHLNFYLHLKVMTHRDLTVTSPLLTTRRHVQVALLAVVATVL